MVVKGNGVEETPYRFGAPAIGSIRDGVGQIQQRRCSNGHPNETKTINFHACYDGGRGHEPRGAAVL
jgi:hypothetical protein